MYKLYRYNENEYRICITKYENSNNFLYNDNDDKITDDLEIERIVLSRSIRMIKEYIKCNNFTYFFTATVNSDFCDRYSLSECQKSIRKIIKSIKRKKKDFIYLFITECHKDGAFHFHGVCSDFPDDDLFINEYGYFSSYSFEKLGFFSMSLIKNKDKCSSYIIKYITKEPVRDLRGSFYFCSRGLKRAECYDIKPIDISNFNFYENDFCKILDFDLSCLPADKILYLMNNIKEK